MNSGDKVLILCGSRNIWEFSLILVAYGSDWLCVCVSFVLRFNLCNAFV